MRKLNKSSKETVANLEEILEKLCKELFLKLGIEVEFSITKETKKGESPTLFVNINSKKEKGLLIGRRGTTLLAIQYFLGIALKQKIGEWVRVVVNVGDWRQRAEEYLEQLARQAASRALETGEPQNLYNLSPSQRRTIHLFLSDDKNITTESIGEGEERYLVVKPKNQ